MKARCGLKLFFLLLTPVSLSQAENKSLTLHECINEALGRSPRLTSEQYNLAGDQEAIKKARAGLLPNLEIHG